jgi:hypothetical protein
MKLRVVSLRQGRRASGQGAVGWGVVEIFTDVFTITFTVHPTRWTMFRNMPTPLGGQLYVTLST